MKVAFIPPRGMTSYASRGDILMCLAQLLNASLDPSYDETMSRLRSKKFALLDNGANEGQPLTGEALAYIDKIFEPDELVLPDVLGNADETYKTSTEYLRVFGRAGASYMGVVQGTNRSELQSLIARYAKVSSITTLGLPRLLLDRTYHAIRLDMATWVDTNFPNRFQVHFLGASSTWLKEPYFASKYGTPARSIDTSLPFNYGLAGVRIEDYQGVTDKKIDRPEGYFERMHSLNARTTVLYNMEIYKEWCNGTKAPSSQL